MTKLILRLFEKNDGDLQSPVVRTAVGKFAGIVGILCNTLLFAMKLFAGLSAGAVSVVADAMNNLSDAASSVVTFLGFRLAQRPADPDHPYGHARYEYLSGLSVAVLILVIGVELAKSAISRIISPETVVFTAVTFWVLVVSLLVKGWMSLLFANLGKKIGATALRATAADCRNDVIASSSVLLGCLVERIWHMNIDGYVGLAVAGFVLYSGVGIARETISPLLGQRADSEVLRSIEQRVCSHEKVLGIHDLLVHDYGPGRCYASVHVEISAQVDPLICHDIIDSIEADVLEALNVQLVIHYDPVLENDAEWTSMRQLVQRLIAQLSPDYSMHDFRLVRGATQTKLVFDLAIPYSCTSADARRIKKFIDDQLKVGNYPYTTVIRFDNQE